MCIVQQDSLGQFQSFSGNKDKTMVSMIRFLDIVTELSFTILDVTFADVQRCQPKGMKIQ